ncbi:type II toxin-antitoxin system HicB family antitoxin [Roseicella aerolata]|uniref:Type II toxin-antitoxin system HicB family antitoxin n=1 Tax=Roseicella aerolata TaxID=2883479 RepID=A0A9X1LC63_9PROT|nr:type II toxin-antitoxin system HicB family antitoxin [Roseicella aerolata]MCB4823808.1 type II toxin-antitoxin system HicB family antitoxin [Roseicella aerolata]
MTVLTYKGYQGAVTFEDGRLLIQVLHVDDFLTSECDKASEAQQTFEDLVEGYLETCRLVGKEPSKPFKGSLNVRMLPELHRKAAMAATRCGETLNAWISRAIEEKLNSDAAKNQNPVDQLAQILRVAAERAQQRSDFSPKRDVSQHHSLLDLTVRREVLVADVSERIPVVLQNQMAWQVKH